MDEPAQTGKYLALLRGINVGGKNRVEMPRLAALFVGLGFNDVETYINTGNVVFRSDATPADALVATIEAGINEHFGLGVKVLVKNAATIEAIAADLPDSWSNDKTMKSDVLFLWDEVADPRVIEALTVVDGIDDVRYSNGALLWRVDRSVQSRSGMNKLVGTQLYRQMTVRNCNTFRRLAALMA